MPSKPPRANYRLPNLAVGGLFGLTPGTRVQISDPKCKLHTMIGTVSQPRACALPGRVSVRLAGKRREYRIESLRVIGPTKPLPAVSAEPTKARLFGARLYKI